jgi:hypothetical protein
MRKLQPASSFGISARGLSSMTNSAEPYPLNDLRQTNSRAAISLLGAPSPWSRSGSDDRKGENYESCRLSGLIMLMRHIR